MAWREKNVAGCGRLDLLSLGKYRDSIESMLSVLFHRVRQARRQLVGRREHAGSKSFAERATARVAVSIPPCLHATSPNHGKYTSLQQWSPECSLTFPAIRPALILDVSCAYVATRYWPSTHRRPFGPWWLFPFFSLYPQASQQQWNSQTFRLTIPAFSLGCSPFL